MSGGRTIWWPKDSGWWRREYIVALGEQFGAAGPAVLDWLSCEAKAQNDGGIVKAGVRSAARGTFVEPATVSRILVTAVTLGALHDLEECDGRFTCRISGWSKDNERGGTALRVARHRAKSEDGVTGGNGVVTPETHREEDRTEGLASNDASQRARKKVDQDAVPDDLTRALAERSPSVLDVLKSIHAQRGGNQPTMRGAGLALQAYPDRDHLGVARELEHWALAGRGQERDVRDWVRQYRSFLDRAAPGSPTRRARVVGNHLQRQSEWPDWVREHLPEYDPHSTEFGFASMAALRLDARGTLTPEAVRAEVDRQVDRLAAA